MSQMPSSKHPMICQTQRWFNFSLAFFVALSLVASTSLFIENANANAAPTKRAELAANEAKLSKLLGELKTIKKRLSRDLNRHSSINKTFSDTEIKIGKLAAKNRQLTL